MPRSPRTRIAPNIYGDATGIAAVLRFKGTRRERRFPPDTPLKEIRAWLDDTRYELKKGRDLEIRILSPGSLAAAIARYLQPFGGDYKRDQLNLLMHWVDALGDAAGVHSLTIADIKGVVQRWKAEGRSASTINHRRRALAAMYEALLPNHPNIVRMVPREREATPPIRALPMPVAEAIINALPDQTRLVREGKRASRERSKTKARLRVMLWTGIPQATMMRIRPEDIDLEHARVAVQFRRKGRGAPAAVLPLLPEAVEAFREWLRAFAWGRFSTSSMSQSFRRAIKTARTQYPEIPLNWRVYDLRHTFLSYMLEMTGDPTAVSVLAQHTDWRSTQRYTQRGASLRAVAAIETVTKMRGTKPILAVTI